jgi:hypothetical protein
VSHFDQGAVTPGPGQQPAGYGEVFVPAAVEILSSDGGLALPDPRRRRTGLIAGITTVAVLAAAAGGFAAWSALGGGGPQPEDVLPASTIAFAKVDLDPSAGQKVELFKLLQKFPEAAQLQGTDKDFGDWLVRRLVESDASTTGIEFGRDIKPWLGKRFAVAGVPGPDAKEPVDGLVVLQETDEKAATASLEKIRRTPGASKLDYAFQDGYVVISPGSTTAARAAVKAGQAAPLAKDARFMSDIASLQSDQVVTAWADAGAVGRLIKQQAGSLSGIPGGQFGSLVDSAYRGSWVLGLHAANGAVELQVNTRGGTPSPSTPPIAHLNNVAPDAWGVLAISGMDQRVDSMWKQLAAVPAYKSAIRQAEGELGLDLPGDLKTLLGSELELSIGGNISQQPLIVAAATSKDPAAAQKLLNRLLQRAGAPPNVVAERIGEPYTLYVGSSQDAVDTAGDNSFTANVLYDEAVADPATAEVIVFVDMTQVWKTMGDKLITASDKEAAHIAAIGFSGRHQGGDSANTLRIILR